MASQINPQQQMLMKIFPYFLPVISFTLPAGIVLYFLVSNLYRIGQQAFITRTMYRDEHGNPIHHGGSDDSSGAKATAERPKGILASLRQTMAESGPRVGPNANGGKPGQGRRQGRRNQGRHGDEGECEECREGRHHHEGWREERGRNQQGRGQAPGADDEAGGHEPDSPEERRLEELEPHHGTRAGGRRRHGGTHRRTAPRPSPSRRPPAPNPNRSRAKKRRR